VMANLHEKMCRLGIYLFLEFCLKESMAITAKNLFLTGGPLSRLWVWAEGRSILKPERWLGIKPEPSSELRSPWSLKPGSWKVKGWTSYRPIVIPSEKDHWIRKGKHWIGMRNSGEGREEWLLLRNLHDNLNISRNQKRRLK
jgi:hypothetical protein